MVPGMVSLSSLGVKIGHRPLRKDEVKSRVDDAAQSKHGVSSCYVDSYELPFLRLRTQLVPRLQALLVEASVSLFSVGLWASASPWGPSALIRAKQVKCMLNSIALTWL